MKIEFVEFDRDFLSKSWEWLNDREIKYLTNTPDFSKEEQVEWFNKIRARTDYLIYGVIVDSMKVGACGLKNITENDCEYWGYIGEKHYWGRGIGKVMMDFIEEKAKELKLKSIWLKVIDNNERAIALYKRVGFKIEKFDNKLIIMRKSL